MQDVYGVAFSPDGMSLASGANNWPLLWDVASGERTCQIDPVANRVLAVAFSPDGRYVAALSHRWQVGVWALAPPRLLHCLDVPPGYFVDNADFTFSPDGKRFAFSASKWATMWDTETGVQRRQFELPPGLQDCLIFDPAGQKLLLLRFETEGAQTPPRKETLLEPASCAAPARVPGAD